MKWLKFVRTFKEGVSNFSRNGSLTFVTVTILSISLFAISATLLYLYMAYGAMEIAQDKVNVNIYFKKDIEESKILEAKKTIESFDGVKYVNYKSREESFNEFKLMSEKNETLKKALDVIEGENPLYASLIVGAYDHKKFEEILKRSQNSFFGQDIAYDNFDSNKGEIERIASVIKLAQKAGIVSGAVFVLIGILITFNTVKLTIYAHKQEFEVMRLVGASNIYIRMPFIFEGIFYGLVSAIIVVILLFATAYFISPLTEGNMIQGNAIKLYINNIFIIFGGVFGAGILLGMVSSFIAIRKYLKV